MTDQPIKLSEQAEATLRAFPGGADFKIDPEQRWTGASELAKELGCTVRQVRGYLGTLCKKGLIIQDEQEAGSVYRLTSKGCYWLAENTDAAPEPDEDDEPTVAAFLCYYGYTKPKGLCKALRAAAKDWREAGKSRKDFLAGCAELGLNVSNAAAEWQASRNS